MVRPTCTRGARRRTAVPLPPSALATATSAHFKYGKAPASRPCHPPSTDLDLSRVTNKARVGIGTMRRSNKSACSRSTALYKRSLRSRWAHDRQLHGRNCSRTAKGGVCNSRGLSCGCLLTCESSPVLAACLQTRPRPMARQPRREGSPPITSPQRTAAQGSSAESRGRKTSSPHPADAASCSA